MQDNTPTQNNNQQSATKTKQPLVFNSGSLMDTKAKGQRNIFVAEQDSKKNNTNVKPKKPFPVKTFLKITIPFFIVLGTGIAVYANWGTIYHEFFEVSEERAHELLIAKKPESFIKMYNKLIEKETDPKEKATLYLTRALALKEAFDNNYISQCISDAYAAEKIYPSYTTANFIVELERAYGSQEKAEEWEKVLPNREGKEIILSNG